MTDDVSRILGQLESSIKALSDQQAQFRVEQRADNKQIFDKLENIAVHGCAIGKRNSEAIRELKERPERLVGMGSAIASVLAFLGSLVMWVIVRMKT